MKRDLIGFISDHLKVPVIGTEDLKSHYLFGPKQWLRMILFAAVSFLIYLAVFTNQAPILKFLSTPGTWHRVVAALPIALFVPAVAWVYGSFASYILKLIKLE